MDVNSGGQFETSFEDSLSCPPLPILVVSSDQVSGANARRDLLENANSRNYYMGAYMQFILYLNDLTDVSLGSLQRGIQNQNGANVYDCARYYGHERDARAINAFYFIRASVAW